MWLIYCWQVSDHLEKKDAVLSEVLNAANLDPASFNQVSHQLEVRSSDHQRSTTYIVIIMTCIFLTCKTIFTTNNA